MQKQCCGWAAAAQRPKVDNPVVDRSAFYCIVSSSTCSDEMEFGTMIGMNNEETTQLPEMISAASSMYRVMNPTSISISRIPRGN
jgi:hypothetical protein